MQKVRVSLGTKGYDIWVGQGLLTELGTRCQELKLGKSCVVVSDEIVAKHYAKDVIESLKGADFETGLFTIPAGDASKNLKNLRAGYDYLAKLRLERSAFIVALGGGVVGDVAGFLAASYLRGIDFIQVPTTLLSQVDSSVGGKVGVNLKAGKNLVGAFHQPRLVLCDLDVLKSLPPREFRSGLSEVIKYGIIADLKLFSQIEQERKNILNRDAELLSMIITRSCQIKASLVESDEREEGLRAALNYGHTIGHALEAMTRYGKYLHGEAIAIGQVAAAHLSSRYLGLSKRSVGRIRKLISAFDLPIGVRLTKLQRKRLFDAMRLDKKVSGGELRFVLAKRIGKPQINQPVKEEVIVKVLDELEELTNLPTY